MTKKIAVVLACVSAALMTGVGAATAAPKNGLVFDVTCTGLGSFQVAEGNNYGRFSPVWGIGKVFIPYEVEGTVTVDGVLVEEFHDVKPAPVPTSAVECDFATSFSDGEALIEITGTAVVVPRGAAG